MKKILITGAGGGGSNNLIRSIKHSEYPVTIIGSNADQFALPCSLADKNYLIPRGDSGDVYFDAINEIVKREDIDLLVPNNDTEVRVMAFNRESLAAPVFLPAKETIQMCQDKFIFNQKMIASGFKVAETISINTMDDVDKAFEHFKGHVKLWCRMRKGSGSAGALPVSKPEQAKAWINYWQDMRNVPEGMFTLSEYLPGRDYAFQSLWQNGKLIIAKTCERLAYHFARQMPSNASSTPSLGKLVHNSVVDDLCTRAVYSIDPQATGMFSIDLKEDRFGNPCITEINIGRFFMITIVFNIVGKYNMAEYYLKLAFNEPVYIQEAERYNDIGDEEYYLIRGLDNPPAIISANEMKKNIINLVDE